MKVVPCVALMVSLPSPAMLAESPVMASMALRCHGARCRQ